MGRINPTREDLISLAEDYKTRDKKEFTSINLNKEQLIADYFIGVGCVKSTSNYFKIPVKKVCEVLEKCGLL